MEQSKTITLERLIKINENDQRFLFRYLSRLPLEYRIEVMQRHRRLIHKLKEHYSQLEIEMLSYGAMVLAIKTFYNEEKQLSKKRFDDLTLEEIGELTMRQIKTFDQKRLTSSPKRDTLIGYWAEVKTIKKTGKGFRFIAKYLLKKHRFKVGHTLIQTTWNQLETIK